MKVLIVILFLICFIWLFKVASGGLNPLKLNAVSYCFYHLLFFQVIGSCFIFIGFNNHYLIEKIKLEGTIDRTFACLVYAMLVFPVVIIIINKRYKGKENRINARKVDNLYDDVNRYWEVVLFLTVISMMACFYTFYKIGYVSIVKVLLSSAAFSFDTERIINNRLFAGSQYIRNIFFLTLSPMLSYSCYIFFRSSQLRKWKILFGINCVITILAKTYDFSKAPILVFIIGLFIIDGFYEQKSSKLKKKIILLVVVSVLIVLFSYTVVMKYTGGWLSLRHGPVSRIIITGATTLFLHFDVFDTTHDYLCGASFARWIGRILGQKDWGQRSGRVLMQILNPGGIAAGTAGVMNSIFLGEAYANFGYIGVFISPIIVGIWFAFIQNYIEHREHTPITLITYVTLLDYFTGAVGGGFVEFVYSSDFIIRLFFLFVIHVIGNHGVIKFPKRSKLMKRFIDC